MKTPNSTVNNQLKQLVNDGLSVEEAAECLGLDVDACKLVLTSAEGTEIDCEELINSRKVDCIRALIDIGLDTSLDNISARVAALKIIVERKGMLPELDATKLNNVFQRMKVVTDKYANATAALPSAQHQTTVVLENTNLTRTTPNSDQQILELLKIK